MSCVEARKAIREFLHGGMAPARANDLRAHRKRCAECDAEYRELVQGVATISGGAREVAVRATEKFSEDRVRRSLLAADPGRKMRIPRIFLPIAIGAVFVVLAMRTGAPRAQLVVEGGEVWVKSNQIETPEPVTLQRFDTCVTGADGRARIQFAENRLELDVFSSCLVDRTDSISIRLFEGTARLQGDARVLLPLGAVETRASVARIALDDRGFTITCTGGEVVYQDGATREPVRPGTDLRVDVATDAPQEVGADESTPSNSAGEPAVPAPVDSTAPSATAPTNTAPSATAPTNTAPSATAPTSTAPSATSGSTPTPR